MQEYFKERLKIVSFDKLLFLREFQKSRRWLNSKELAELAKWAESHQKERYRIGDCLFELMDDFKRESQESFR
ncbi:MAG: hypothetical protein HGA37_14260 [Lentimicrobium sp.]|nr:hypothetical protein [Lentimicrobium sp.]